MSRATITSQSMTGSSAEFRGGEAVLPSYGDALPYSPSVGDYVALLKPRVMSLVVFTGLVGLYVAPGELHRPGPGPDS